MSVLKIKDPKTGEWINVPYVSSGLSPELEDYIKTEVVALENVLIDILETLQGNEELSVKVEEMEQIIVAYFENKTVEEVEG